jgi:hypothetical protein
VLNIDAILSIGHLALGCLFLSRAARSHREDSNFLHVRIDIVSLSIVVLVRLEGILLEKTDLVLLNHLEVHVRKFILTFSSFHFIVVPLSISYYIWLM